MFKNILPILNNPYVQCMTGICLLLELLYCKLRYVDIELKNKELELKNKELEFKNKELEFKNKN